MMVSYVAVPSRLIGVKPTYLKTRQADRERRRWGSGRGHLHAAVRARAYRHPDARIAALFIPGIIVVSFATALQAGATGAVKTVKMSAKLLAPRPEPPGDAVVPDDPPTATDARA